MEPYYYVDFSDSFDDLEPDFWEYYYGGPEDSDSFDDLEPDFWEC